MRITRTPRRRLWPWLTAALLVNGALVAGVSSAGAHLEQFDQTPQAAAVGNDGATADEHATLTRTPADEVLTQVLSRDVNALFGAGATAADPVASIYPRVITTCDPVAAAPVSVGARTAQADGYGVLVQLWAMPAGAGTAAVTQMRRDLGECADAPAFDTEPEVGAAWFTASTATGGQHVTWLVFARGDVVASVAFTGDTKPGLARLRDAGQRLDSVLSSALGPVCVELNPTEQDATRNPYLGAYVPYSRAVSLKVSPTKTALHLPDDKPQRSSEFTIPNAVEHADLAPVLPLAADQWKDANGDGVPEVAPTLDDAPRGTAPLFADPAKFTADTTGYTDPGPAPLEPDITAGSVTALIPDLDVDGPGCGWAFTGQEPAVVSDEQVSAAAAEQWRQVLTSVGERRFEAWTARQRWAAQYTAWVHAEAVYAPVREYLAAKDAATVQLTEAQAQFEESRDAYIKALAHPPAGTAAPGPATTGQPTPTPTTPNPGVTTSPTTSPTSPTQGAHQ